MRMIRKINLMGVPLQVEDLLFNINRKKQRKRGCFACGEKGHFWDNCSNSTKPKKRKSKGKVLTMVKTWDDSSSEDEPPKKPWPPLFIMLFTFITQMPYGKR
jgi:hypothetical protein